MIGMLRKGEELRTWLKRTAKATHLRNIQGSSGAPNPIEGHFHLGSRTVDSSRKGLDIPPLLSKRTGKSSNISVLAKLPPKLAEARIPLEAKLKVAEALEKRSWEEPTPHRMAVIVPFRAWTNCSRIDPQGLERNRNLADMTFYLTEFLRIQEVEFRILVIEQESESRALFNRGALMNVGVDIVKEGFGFDYVVLHDADQIPLSEKNAYEFPEIPMHLCTHSSQYLARPRTPDMLGGAVAIQLKQLLRINGYSNKFWSV